jgi:hypothetical protein
VAYKVFTNGSVLNASEINDNLMNQSVMVFSNSAARTAAITSPVEGMLTWLEDVNRYEVYTTTWVELISPAPWVSYTPTLTNLTLGNGSMSAKYAVIGKTLLLKFDIELGSTSSVGSAPRISIPSGFTIASAVAGRPVGLGQTKPGSATSEFTLTTAVLNSTTLYAFVHRSDSTYVIVNDITSTVPATFGTGGYISFRATLEIS